MKTVEPFFDVSELIRTGGSLILSFFQKTGFDGSLVSRFFKE
jgi:hypothetical protein